MSGNIFFHLGNPKAYSTSIQQMLTEGEGPNFRYIGFRPNDDHRKWYRTQTESELFNRDLRFTTGIEFERKAERYRVFFSMLVEDAVASGQDLWLSSENLSMKFLLTDLDTLEKFERLQSLLPPGVRFVIVFRNIFNSIRSIYREYVKLGYAYPFTYFCDEAFLYRDANFLESLFPGRLLTALAGKLKPGNHLDWIFVYQDQEREAELLRDFLEQLSGYQFPPMEHVNRGQLAGQLSSMVAENKRSPLPINAIGLMESHRALWHLSDDDRHKFDPFVWGKLRHIHRNRNIARHLQKETPEVLNIQDDLLAYLELRRKEDLAEFSAFDQQAPLQEYQGLWYER